MGYLAIARACACSARLQLREQRGAVAGKAAGTAAAERGAAAEGGGGAAAGARLQLTYIPTYRSPLEHPTPTYRSTIESATGAFSALQCGAWSSAGEICRCICDEKSL